MTDLSPGAQAVLDAANAAYDDAATVAQGIAAELDGGAQWLLPAGPKKTA